MRVLCVICALLIFGFIFDQKCVLGQESAEIGVIGGGGFYLGELNHNLFPAKLTKPLFGIVGRINRNPRISYKGCLLIGAVAGNDVYSSNPLENSRNLNFMSSIYEGSIQVEFNYFTFELGNPKYPFTNYLFGGISVFKFTPKGDLGAGNESLRELNTEFEKKKYALIQPSIPFGGGIKVNLSKKIATSAEWGLRVTLTDYIDDVSTVYPTGHPYALAQRGNSKSTDWYSFFGIMITYIFINDNTCPEVLSNVR